jgi:hypothetical protein
MRKAAAMLFAALLLSQAAAAQRSDLNEEKVKAGLLYNFLKYTDWPSGDSALDVCLLGGDPFGGGLNPLKGRTAQQQTISILRISGPAQIANCDLLFIHASAAGNLPSILSGASRRGILTMSDIKGFARMGGMVELSMRDDRRIHMIINLRAAQAAGINIQPRMMRLAELVRP